ncbi:MAG TPA: EAL domain-containing protein [Candidatus Limnocylindrales bacterium]|nr:EAL domain-containing protein [Candidatus Limnocylindrales bacterium]
MDVPLRPAERPAQPGLPTESVAGALIYIVDDAPANTVLLEQVLRRAGFRNVRAFTDGAAVLEAVEAEEPDLILLDLHMPGLDGLSVLRRLRATRPADTYLPVVVLTADVTWEARRRVLEGGATDFLTKPFEAAEVNLRVRNVVETRLLHEELRRRNTQLRSEVEIAAQRLAEHEVEWAEQAGVLARLEASESAEETAQHICDAMTELRGVDIAVVVYLDVAGQALPLGRSALADTRVGVNRPLPAEVTARWRQRVERGPWIGPWEPVFGTPSRRIVRQSNPEAMAILPLRSGRSALGALIVATSERDALARLAARLPVLESFAAVTAALVAPDLEARQRRSGLQSQIESVLRHRAFEPVFQPIVRIDDGDVVGYEALTRFHDGTRPDRRFADAAAVGLGTELELACLGAAIDGARALPAGRWLSLNASPALILNDRRLRSALRRADRPAVLEVTEHVAIDDYRSFRASLKGLGRRIRVSVDDAGAGFASFRHILELRPDFVKLDIGLVHAIEHDNARQALVAGMVYFAAHSGCQLVAEGVETVAERDALRELRVALGQGFFFGRPTTVEAGFEPSAERVLRAS